MPNLNRVFYPVLGSVILGLLAFIYGQHTTLEEAELAYQNPYRQTRTHVVRLKGPTVTVTKVIREPVPGDTRYKETVETTVKDAGETVTTDATETVKPVPLAQVVTPRLSLVAGFGLEPFSPKDTRAWRGYGGVSFREGLEVLGGVGYDERPRLSVLALWRFR